MEQENYKIEVDCVHCKKPFYVELEGQEIKDYHNGKTLSTKCHYCKKRIEFKSQPVVTSSSRELGINKSKKPWYKRWWAITLFIIVGLAILGNLFGGTEEGTTPNIQKETPEVKVYYKGDRFIVGSFAYTVNAYYSADKIGQDVLGTFMGEKADGMFIIVNVTIENVGKESKTLWDSYIKILDDQERRFEHDSSAEFYLSSEDRFSFEQMQPGLPKTGLIVFDVPQNIKGMLEISSDNLFSSETKYVSWSKKN